MSRYASRTLFLALCVVGASVLAWVLYREDAEETAPLPAARELGDEAPRGGRTRETPPDIAPGPTPEPQVLSNDVVPRILPPDAAIEDIRDALAITAAERKEPLQLAFINAERLAGGTSRVASLLRRRVADLTDRRVRGVAIAASGIDRSEANTKRLRLLLRDGESNEVRMGALIALARPPSEWNEIPASAESSLLGGLRYTYAPLPDESRLLAVVGRVLDDVDGVAFRDALPIIMHSAKTRAVYATVLAADGKRACRWYRTLSKEDRDTLRTRILHHKSLLPEVRRVLNGR